MRVQAHTGRKGLTLTKALKSAARFPVRVSHGRGSGRNTFSPNPGEQPVVLCRIQILSCADLVSKHGSSDPFVVVSMLNTRHQTPVCRRNTNPVYAAKDATFDFPVYLSLADKLGAVEFVVWDKDVLKKEYLGEVALPLEDWFSGNRGLGFNDPENKPLSLNLLSTRANNPVTGSVQVKFGFVHPPNPQHALEYDAVFAELVKRSRPSLVSAPPTEGIGTIRSHYGGPAYEDDGGISSDEGEPQTDEDDEDEEAGAARALAQLYIPASALTDELQSAPPGAVDPATPDTPQAADAPPPVVVEAPTPLTPTAPTLKTPVPSKAFIPRLGFRARTPMARAASADAARPPAASASSPASPTSSVGLQHAQAGRPHMKKQKFRKSWMWKKGDYNFSAENDILGIVMLEIQGATDLPRLKNITRTGWDMDPFVVISFGKKVFRTRVIRHSLNPTWDEKLLFHVRRYEAAFQVQLTVLDWDKLSSNDHVGDAAFGVAELLADAPQPDPVTGLYDEREQGNHAPKEFRLPLTTAKEMPWEAKHNPVIMFKAKYQPYDALRQQFWRQYLRQYDSDDTGRLSHIELTSMLDSLGSTLTNSTIDSFFTRHGKTPAVDELTVAEVIQCLETELGRPYSEKKRIAPGAQDDGLGLTGTSSAATSTSDPATPTRTGGEAAHALALEHMDFAGPPAAGTLNGGSTASSSASEPDSPPARDAVARPLPPPGPYATEPMEQALGEVAAPITPSDLLPPTPPAAPPLSRAQSGSSSDPEDTTPSSSSASTHVERVINIKNCPLCHRPRLHSKAEVDIVTHLAVCASQDWGQVDRIVVGNFVTASQAQRKWYTKVISKVSSGNYKLGANSANIIVQNRITGQLEEEKMQVYVRLGIRLLYKGAKSRMEGARARRLLRSMSIKQGVKYDSPESARDIIPFIEFHQLSVDELLIPVSEYKTFNEFFYRKLKPDARPVECPDDPTRLVSAADCRFMAFESVTDATRLWIKGRDFTVARLLGEQYSSHVERYVGGALAIFRLAPQDYHRFHSPVDGTIGPMTYISGEYYTVNPQAIRTTLDVYGENARKIVPIDSPQFGRVMAVCIGAMMVGSIKTTVQEGDTVKRGQEFGYFAFGGSTIVLLFEKGAVEWDEDLLINGRASLETLVRVGMGIGRGRRTSSPRANGSK